MSARGAVLLLAILSAFLTSMFLQPTRKPGAAVESRKISRAKPGQDVEVNLSKIYYTVHGKTIDDLRKEMDRLGPEDSNGHHDSYTNWNVDWHYDYKEDDRKCSLQSVWVSVDLRVQFPKWAEAGHADPVGQMEWNSFLEAADRTSLGYRQIGENAGHAIFQGLAALPPQPTCDAANRTGDALARQLIHSAMTQTTYYGALTDAGRVFGARLPIYRRYDEVDDGSYSLSEFHSRFKTEEADALRALPRDIPYSLVLYGQLKTEQGATVAGLYQISTESLEPLWEEAVSGPPGDLTARLLTSNVLRSDVPALLIELQTKKSALAQVYVLSFDPAGKPAQVFQYHFHESPCGATSYFVKKEEILIREPVCDGAASAEAIKGFRYDAGKRVFEPEKLPP